MATTKEKYERSLYGPSLTEVTLGAFLSVLAGALLGGLFLAFKPVVLAKEVPEEPEFGEVYYVEGSANSARGRQYMRKRQLFMEGGSADVISLSEDELNTWIASSRANPDSQRTSGVLRPQGLNFRVRAGQLQIGLPCTFNLLGLNRKVVVQARGGFVRSGDRFVFAPQEMYFGSLPTHRIPGLTPILARRLLAAQDVPAETYAAWQRLENVRVDNDQLVLAMR